MTQNESKNIKRRIIRIKRIIFSFMFMNRDFHLRVLTCTNHMISYNFPRCHIHPVTNPNMRKRFRTPHYIQSLKKDTLVLGLVMSFRLCKQNLIRLA